MVALIVMDDVVSIHLSICLSFVAYVLWLKKLSEDANTVARPLHSDTNLDFLKTPFSQTVTLTALPYCELWPIHQLVA